MQGGSTHYPRTRAETGSNRDSLAPGDANRRCQRSLIDLLTGSIPSSLVLTGLVFCVAACHTTNELSHAGLSNAVVLGERLHIGDDPDFEVSEVLDEYEVTVSDYEYLVSTGSVATDTTESRDDRAEVAANLLEVDRQRAVKNVEVSASGFTIFIVLAGGGGSEVCAKGEVVKVIPPSQPSSEVEP